MPDASFQGNTFVNSSGTAVISDIGFWWLHEERADIVNLGSRGQTRYEAPELVEMDYTPKPPADVYSLAMLFLAFITGSHPFRLGERHQCNAAQVLNFVLDGGRPEIPANFESFTAVKDHDLLWELITPMWHHTPEQRPSSIDVLKSISRLKCSFQPS